MTRARSPRGAHGPERHLARALVVAALLAPASVSCRFGRTQLAIWLDTDMSQGPGATLTAVRLIQYSQGEASPHADNTLVLGVGSGAVYWLPTNAWVFEPRGGDATREITLDVVALQGDLELFRQRVISPFAPGVTSVVPVFLADRCRAARAICPAGFTCGRRGCEPARRTPEPAGDGGVPLASDDGAVPAAGCAPGTDLATDPMNCGACGRRCASGRCAARACVGVVHVEQGGGYACGLVSDGTVQCGGLNPNGMLGDGTTAPSPFAAGRRVASLAGVRQLVVGFNTACALAGDATLCWGMNSSGQAGVGMVSANVTVPTPVAGLTGAVQVSLHAYHGCAVDAAGAVYCWGSRSRVGVTTATDLPAPVRVDGLPPIARVAAGIESTCAWTAAGAAYCWGGFVPGDGSPHDTPVAADVLGPVLQVVHGTQFGCALRADHTVVCWGNNRYGALGRGLAADVDAYDPMPEPVVGLANVEEIGAGWWHACARLADGTVRCWGRNDIGGGLLGDGTTVSRGTPVPVAGLTDATQIGIGSDASCASTAAGAAVCWNGAVFSVPF